MIIELSNKLNHTYLALHLAGFTMHLHVAVKPVCSYHTISPLPIFQAVYFLLHFPSDHSGWALPSTMLLWCPDFPQIKSAVPYHLIKIKDTSYVIDKQELTKACYISDTSSTIKDIRGNLCPYS